MLHIDVQSALVSEHACMSQVGNVLEELSGKEVKVCTDATCSRILEAMIPSIGIEQMLPLLAAFAQGEEFCMLASRCHPLQVFYQEVGCNKGKQREGAQVYPFPWQ